MRSVMLRRAEDVAHQDEQRRSDERKRVHRLRHLLRHDRRREPAEADEGERREPHRREQRHAGEDGDEPYADDLEHEVDHSTRISTADARRRRAGARSASTSSSAPCAASLRLPGRAARTSTPSRSAASSPRGRGSARRDRRRTSRPARRSSAMRRLDRDLAPRRAQRFGSRSWKKRMRMWTRLRRREHPAEHREPHHQEARRARRSRSADRRARA